MEERQSGHVLLRLTPTIPDVEKLNGGSALKFRFAAIHHKVEAESSQGRLHEDPQRIRKFLDSGVMTSIGYHILGPGRLNAPLTSPFRL